jgi:hypothetical protein
MRLLGDWNWYLPTWLEWLPKINVEGHEPTREAEVLLPELEPVGMEGNGSQPEVVPVRDDR